MFGSEILETAIGLVFVYLMFSLVCSGVKEWIHYLLNVRSKSLEEEIRRMLTNSDLVDAIYNHDLVGDSGQSGIFKKLLGLGGPTTPEGDKKVVPIKAGNAKLTSISPDSFAEALLDCITSAAASKGKSKAADQLFDSIKKGIEQIVNKEVRNVLLNLLNKASSEEKELKKRVEEAVQVVEKWYENSMGKLSAWYRKKSKQLIFVTALVLVVTYNVDSIMIVKMLSQDPAIRTTVLFEAEKLSSQQQDYMKYRSEPKKLAPAAVSVEAAPGTASTETGTAPSTETGTAPSTEPSTETTAENESTPGNAGKELMTTEKLFEEVEQLKAQLRASSLPLGWVKRDESSKTTVTDPRVVPVRDDYLGWIYKIIGLMISLMAISIGAPFWFDILKKMLDLRKNRFFQPSGAGNENGAQGAGK